MKYNPKADFFPAPDEILSTVGRWAQEREALRQKIRGELAVATQKVEELSQALKTLDGAEFIMEKRTPSPAVPVSPPVFPRSGAPRLYPRSRNGRAITDFVSAILSDEPEGLFLREIVEKFASGWPEIPESRVRSRVYYMVHKGMLESTRDGRADNQCLEKLYRLPRADDLLDKNENASTLS